jgi:pilus assembly protein CpaF
MTTTHANSSRDAFSRLETMVMMVSQNVPDVVIRHMLVSAVQMVLHCSRLADGTRKITAISEVVGVERDQVEMRDIFVLERSGLDAQGRVVAKFVASGERPLCMDRLKSYGVRLPDSIFSDTQELKER